MEQIHFVGVGGSGMSGLAGILQMKGKGKVSGSDGNDSAVLAHLRARGGSIFVGHKKEQLPKNTSLVIRSLAVSEKNPEVEEARRRKIPVMTYPEAVGELLTKNLMTIAICGTHGKSTITAMLAKVLIENDFDPTVLLGANMRELGGQNFRVGKGSLFVVEACEYYRAFLNYHPRMILLNTLDPDHLDYYKDFDDYCNAFRSFLRRLPRDGYFFANNDDDDVQQILRELQEEQFPSYNTFTYSSKYEASSYYLSGKEIRSSRTNPSLRAQLELSIPGFHNRMNALGVFAICSTMGIAPGAILKSLQGYAGASRRFELVGKVGKTQIIDDYGHHPAEIAATMQAAREKFPKGKICLVFQPHQYSRTKKLFTEFVESLGLADTVVIPNIYEARDAADDKAGTSAQELVQAIQKKHDPDAAVWTENFDKTVEFLKENHQKYTMIMTMGAGDVWKVAHQMGKEGRTSAIGKVDGNEKQC